MEPTRCRFNNSNISSGVKLSRGRSSSGTGLGDRGMIISAFRSSVWYVRSEMVKGKESAYSVIGI